MSDCKSGWYSEAATMVGIALVILSIGGCYHICKATNAKYGSVNVCVESDVGHD